MKKKEQQERGTNEEEKGERGREGGREGERASASERGWEGGRAREREEEEEDDDEEEELDVRERRREKGESLGRCAEGRMCRCPVVVCVFVCVRACGSLGLCEEWKPFRVDRFH